MTTSDGPEIRAAVKLNGITYRAMVFEHHGEDSYIDWSVIASDGRILRQDRDEIEDGMPTQGEVERYLAETVRNAR